MSQLFHVWVYLETTPLLGLMATLCAWRLALAITARANGHALAHPVPIAIALLVVVLLATGTPYAAYFQGAQYIHFLLGPATVALAIPMHANLSRIRASAGAILPAIVAGSLTASVTAIVCARLLGASRSITLSLAPKSVTTPIAMGIAEQIGGDPSMAAAFVLLTGIVAGLIAIPALRWIGVRDWRAVGLAAGTAGHGLATARMLTISETASAFGGLAIGINGALTAMFVPLLATLLIR